MSSRRLVFIISGSGPGARQNELRKAPFEHFMALAQELSQMSSRSCPRLRGGTAKLDSDK